MRREIQAVRSFLIAVLAMCIMGKSLNGTRGKYVIIHALANVSITLLAFPDAWFALNEPHSSLEEQPNVHPFSIVVAIHAYHVLCYDLTSADWLHHIVMIVGTVPANALHNCGCLVNLCSFSICGAPGAICYTAIALRKNDIITRTVEKRINAAVNTWFRTPLITITSYVIFIAAKDSHLNYQMLIALLVFWNGQYYGRQVVENYGAHVGRSAGDCRTPPPTAC